MVFIFPRYSMRVCFRNLLIVLVWLGGAELAFAPIFAEGVQVTILPASAVSAGAEWELDGSSPIPSGAEFSAPAGLHTVSFTPVSGFITPPNEQVTVTNNQVTMTNGVYIQIPTLKITATATNAAKISWPSASAGFTLEQNGNLTTSNWMTNRVTPSDDGTNMSVVVTNLGASNWYFRLKR